jgi:hypothetical protein
MSYLPGSYKVRSGPGVSGVRFQADSRFFTTTGCMKLRQNGTVFRVLNWPLWQPAGTANRRISNFEGWKRFAKSFLKQTKYIHSTFDVGRSMFGVHQFLFRLDRPFFLAGGWADTFSSLQHVVRKKPNKGLSLRWLLHLCQCLPG